MWDVWRLHRYIYGGYNFIYFLAPSIRKYITFINKANAGLLSFRYIALGNWQKSIGNFKILHPENGYDKM